MKQNSSAAILGGLMFAVGAIATANAQMPARHENNDPALKIYRETPPKINDLVHTKLAVSFDYKKCYLYGKEWVTLKPHIYATDTLRLDAKGMDIHNISIVRNGKNFPLKYVYQDSASLAIHLDRVYHNSESYTIYIDYTAKPNELSHHKGSRAITDAKDCIS
jgi:aminopeptidase N